MYILVDSEAFIHTMSNTVMLTTACHSIPAKCSIIYLVKSSQL